MLAMASFIMRKVGRKPASGVWRIWPRSRFDRHRGGSHLPTPATPPCERVRTRRFEKLG
jgi:hypothetical protein